jgi:hypothetical protein
MSKIWPVMKRLEVNRNYMSDVWPELWECEVEEKENGNWVATTYGNSEKQCCSRANAIVALGKAGDRE